MVNNQWKCPQKSRYCININSVFIIFLNIFSLDLRCVQGVHSFVIHWKTMNIFWKTMYILENYVYIHFTVCVYCNRSQKTSHRVKNNSYATRLSLLSYVLFFTRCDIFCDVLQYTHTEKCYLFVLYNKHSNSLLNGFWGVF